MSGQKPHTTPVLTNMYSRGSSKQREGNKGERDRRNNTQEGTKHKRKHMVHNTIPPSSYALRDEKYERRGS